MAADTPPPEVAEQNGNGSAGNGLFDDYVQGAPEELKPYATEMAKEFSKRVDGKLREAADYRKQWEPYEQVEGLRDLGPEELSGLIQLAQMDEDGFKEWLGQAAQEVGWQPELDEDAWAAYGREQGWIDDDGEGLDDDDPVMQQLSQMAETIQGLQQQLEQGQRQQQQQEGISQAEAEMQSQLEAVQQQVGDAWTPELRQEIINLARLHIDEDDPIAAGYQHYQKLTGAAQGDLVDRKLTEETISLNGGAVDTKPAELSWHGGASPKDAARQRFAQT
jgi:hypothetical protein